MHTRNFSKKPNLTALGNIELTKEQHQLLKQGWVEHLSKEGWACPRLNLVYALLRGKSLEDAFTPISNANKLQSTPYQDPWYFVNSRLSYLVTSVSATKREVEGYKRDLNTEANFLSWFGPWKDLLPVDIYYQLGDRVRAALYAPKSINP